MSHFSEGLPKEPDYDDPYADEGQLPVDVPMPAQMPDRAPLSTAEEWDGFLHNAQKTGQAFAQKYAERAEAAGAKEVNYDEEGREVRSKTPDLTELVDPDTFIVGLVRRKRSLRNLLSPHYPVEERPLAAWTVLRREVEAPASKEGVSKSADSPVPRHTGFDESDFGVAPEAADNAPVQRNGNVAVQRLVVTENGKTYLLEGSSDRMDNPDDPLRIAVPVPRKKGNEAEPMDQAAIDKYLGLKRNAGVFSAEMHATLITTEGARTAESKTRDPLTAQLALDGLRGRYVKAQMNAEKRQAAAKQQS